MQLPLQVRYCGLRASPETALTIRSQAAALERFSDHIKECELDVELWHRHHQQGSLFRVAMQLALPSGDLAVARELERGPDRAADKPALEGLIREVFGEAERRVEAALRDTRPPRALHERSDEERRLGPLHALQDKPPRRGTFEDDV